MALGAHGAHHAHGADDVDGAAARAHGGGDRPAEPRVVLLGRDGCHLCDEARAVVERVTADLGVAWQERSVDDDPHLLQTYGEQIPVTFVDGRRHDFWRVDEGRLRRALGGG